MLTPTVKQRFDVVEMDPRGVGNSGGFRCNGGDTNESGAGTGAKVDPVPTTPRPGPRSSTRTVATRRRAPKLQDRCSDSSAPPTSPATSTSCARRSARRSLTFLGISYGTLVGATYADLFPTHVRALVLDGVIDPALPTFELWMAQAVGFQQQLDAFFASCGERLRVATRRIPLAGRARPPHRNASARNR